MSASVNLSATIESLVAEARPVAQIVDVQWVGEDELGGLVSCLWCRVAHMAPCRVSREKGRFLEQWAWGEAWAVPGEAPASGSG